MALQLVASSIADFEIGKAVTFFDPAYIGPDLDEAFGLKVDGDFARSRFKEDLANHWTSFNVVPYNVGGNAGHLRIIYRNTTQWPFVFTSNMEVYIDFLTVRLSVNGSLVSAGSINLTADTDNRVDIRVKIHPTDGEFTVYVNGVISAQYLGNTSHGLTTHNSISLEGRGSNGSWSGYAFSGLMIGTGDSRLLLVKSMPIVGNGFFQDWVGDYADIVDVGGVNDATFIHGTTPGLQATYEVAHPTTPVGYDVRAIVLSAKIAKYGETVDGVDAIWYDGINVEVMGPLTRLDVGFTNDQVISESNPVTGLRYTDADLASLQLGVQTT